VRIEKQLAGDIATDWINSSVRDVVSAVFPAARLRSAPDMFMRGMLKRGHPGTGAGSFPTRSNGCK
jgi:hypothetical protein